MILQNHLKFLLDLIRCILWTLCTLLYFRCHTSSYAPSTYSSYSCKFPSANFCILHSHCMPYNCQSNLECKIVNSIRICQQLIITKQTRNLWISCKVSLLPIYSSKYNYFHLSPFYTLLFLHNQNTLCSICIFFYFYFHNIYTQHFHIIVDQKIQKKSLYYIICYQSSIYMLSRIRIKLNIWLYRIGYFVGNSPKHLCIKFLFAISTISHSNNN